MLFKWTRLTHRVPFLGESVQDAVISKTPDGCKVTEPTRIIACAVGNIATDKRRLMKNIKISRPGQRCIRPGFDFDCDLCECGSPLTPTRETCSSGARMGASVSGRMHVLGDWHTCARFKVSKLGVCARQLVQLLESGLLRRLLPSLAASPAAAGLCSRGGPLPAPSAHEHPSSLFRAPPSSRKRLRRLLSRGSMASAVCAVHTRAIYFSQSVSGCRRAASAQDSGPTGDPLYRRGRKRKLHLRPCPESASTQEKSGHARRTRYFDRGLLPTSTLLVRAGSVATLHQADI
jgi:hypothetical protein